jgi:hypothetical protein
MNRWAIVVRPTTGLLKAADEERFVLPAMHKIPVQRGLCLRARVIKQRYPE